MRRSSYTPLPPEPLIVVEEAEGSDEDHEQDETQEDDKMDVAGAVTNYSIDEEDDDDQDPGIDPALLCPWRDPRDLRKRSLPTPSCTSGITASQVRRLSERSAASARDSAFLATLTSAPAPGRRHSVTISRVPTTFYPGSKGRRESIAVLPSGRRDSSAAANFNLHLDIMDDIAEIKGARKAKMLLYKTGSKEQVCEITDGDSTPVRFHSPAISPMTNTGQLKAPHNEGRRHSDSAGLASMIPSTVLTKRKASEQFSTGIVCTNNDLVKLLTLTNSSQEINIPPPPEFKSDDPTPAAPKSPPPPTIPPPPIPTIIDQNKRSAEVINSSRSNSFDVAMLHEKTDQDQQQKKSAPPPPWIPKRPPPPITSSQSKDEDDTASGETLQPIDAPTEKRNRSQSCISTLPGTKPKESKVVWDKPTGSVVDAQILGSAIEVYLRRGDSASPIDSPSGTASSATGPITTTPTVVPPPSPAAQQTQQSAAENKPKEAPRETSTSSSICSTFKDLFVK